MNDASKLLKNTLLLAVSTIVLRLCALFFQSYLAERVGAEQLGIFGVISSVGTVFATIAISGVRFSVTRLVAEEDSTGNTYPHSLMRCAYLYAVTFGCASGITMYMGAETFSHHWIMNRNAITALRIMAVSMPLIALGSVAEGYFTAKQKIFRLVVIEFIAQLCRIVFVAICFENGKIVSVTNILSYGMLVAEGLLALGMLFLYLIETTGKKEKTPKKHGFIRLGKTALPLAVSAYMRTGLSSLGQVIIPRGLRRSGMGSSSAFSTYGVITQMSLPVIMFPAALLGALGEILVPKLTEAQVKKQKASISYISNRALRLGMVFSFGVAGAMLCYAELLGKTIYNSAYAGFYIKIFAPLVPIVYIDCVTDGCLKGLNQQVHSMIYNVLEGIINVVLLFVLLPRMAIMGYIAVMYIKEVFNTVLSLRRLSRVTSVDFSSWGLPITAISVWGAWVFGRIIIPSGTLIVTVFVYCLLYVALLYIASAVSRDDIKWIVSLITGDSKNNRKKAVVSVDKMASGR